MERHMATQIIITHKTPAVVQATVLALAPMGRLSPGVSVIVSGPLYVRESAVVEIFSVGSQNFLDCFAEEVELFCEAALATTTVVSVLRQEAEQR